MLSSLKEKLLSDSEQKFVEQDELELIVPSDASFK